jgi:hypothetical protein
MTATLVPVIAFALLFVCWGMLRPADQRQGGCHGCSHGDPSECGRSCPLLDDLETKTRVGVER